MLVQAKFGVVVIDQEGRAGAAQAVDLGAHVAEPADHHAGALPGAAGRCETWPRRFLPAAARYLVDGADADSVGEDRERRAGDAAAVGGEGMPLSVPSFQAG